MIIYSLQAFYIKFLLCCSFPFLSLNICLLLPTWIHRWALLVPRGQVVSLLRAALSEELAAAYSQHLNMSLE